MEQSRLVESPKVGDEGVVLRGGNVWELTTETGERVVVDRGFRPRCGDIRNRWRCGPDGLWRRPFRTSRYVMPRRPGPQPQQGCVNYLPMITPPSTTTGRDYQ